MRTIRILRHRLGSLFRHGRVERELNHEIELHLEQLVREYRAKGMSQAEANLAARREFGSVEIWKEHCRDTRRLNWIHDFVQDLRYALRSLLRTPAFSATAVLTVALGIGVNTAVFNLICTVLLDPLPYRDSQQLVHLAETHPDFPSYQVAAPDFFDWQKTAASFNGIAAYTFQEMNKWTITGDGDPEPIQMVQASSNLFPVLGIQPLIGRAYTAEEEAKKAPVILLSESLWRRKYGSDPSIIGRKIRLVDWPVTVVGVIPQRQAQPSWAQVWMPISFLDIALTESRRFHTLEVIARLKPGTSVERAQAEMNGIAAGFAQTYRPTNGKVGVVVVPMASWATGEVRPALLIAWAAVSLVLLLACANVAHLVLVRSVHRSREIAMRAALGAGSARITRFLLVENLLLAIAGGMAGAFLARALLPFLSRMAPVDLSGVHSWLSPTALLFGVLATVLCAGLFALPAVLYSRRPDVQQIIKQSSGPSLTHRRSWFGPAIIAAEVAMAFVVMTGAGLLYRSFIALLDERTGFDSTGILAAEIPLALDWGQSAKVFEQKVAPALREIPGVTSVAAVNCGPMMLHSTEVSRFSIRFDVVGRPSDPGNLPVAQFRWVTPGYFRTLHIQLVRGRLFADDDLGKAPGYLINETLARRFFPDQNPVGRQLLRNIGVPGTAAVPIVGVVADVRDLGLEREPVPTIYELAVSNRMTLLIRSDLSPTSLIPAVRAAIRAASPQSAIATIAPLDQFIRASIAKRRFALDLLGLFAILAGVLTMIGVYGVISYSLSRRTTEFAIRFALGAERRHVWQVVLRMFAAPTTAGLLAGIWLAHLFARILNTQLYKLSAADPSVLAISAIALVLLVLVSALRPIARAASISPAAALRE